MQVIEGRTAAAATPPPPPALWPPLLLPTSAHPLLPLPVMPRFEMASMRPARAPTGFASLTTSLLAQQREQQQLEAGRRLFSQVPLFELARAAAGPAIEVGLRVVKVAGDGRCMFRWGWAGWLGGRGADF